MTPTSRRHVLVGLAGLIAAPALPAFAARAESNGLILSTGAERPDAFAAYAFDIAGKLRFELPLPGRAHGLAARPGRTEAVAVARRPGRYLMVFDYRSGRRLATVGEAKGRHYNGHGVFSADGRTFFTTETKIADGRGVLGIHDADDGYRRIGEVSSGGFDPHDLRLIDAGRALVVANGGGLTHPDAPKMILNPDHMDPTLAYIDAASGRLVAAVHQAPDRRRLGIRHLAVAADGRVAIAMQYWGATNRVQPLVAVHRPGAASFDFLALPEQTLLAARQYSGGAAVDSSGSLLAVSCPRGNMVLFFATGDGRFLGRARVADGCGVAPAGPGRGFILTSGMGGAFAWDPADGARPIETPSIQARRWDNHAIWVTPAA